MNFLDAVKALKEGRCKGIKRNGFIGLLFINDVNKLVWTGTANPVYAPDINHFLSEDWELVEPIKQYEEIEIIKYVTFAKDGRQLITDTKNFICKSEDDETIKLTGIRKREIKPKVKRRKLIATCDKFGNIVGSIIPGHSNSKIYEEWEE